MRKYAKRYLKNVVPNYSGQGKATKEILRFFPKYKGYQRPKLPQCAFKSVSPFKNNFIVGALNIDDF